MKLVGRLVMVAVAIICFAVNIPIVMNVVKTVQEAGWSFETFFENIKLLISILSSVFYLVVGVAAILAAVTGHVGFWMFFLSVVGIALAIWYCVDGFQKGTMTEIGDILKVISDFGVPLLYAVGAILLKLGRK